jgi:enoyl-[acyl-carrier protein] reductase I
MIDLPKNLLAGKRGLISGIANNMSIAWPIAQFAKECGAELALSYPNDAIKKRLDPLAESIGVKDLFQCDVTDEASIDKMFTEIENKWGKLDFFVHAIAFSDREELRGRYADTSQANFTNTMNISCYSLVSMSKRASALMKDGGSNTYPHLFRRCESYTML